jgi:thiol-disulfide isomerase/thioredoxin
VRIRASGLACALFLALWTHAAPAFVLEDAQGRVHRLSDFKGRWVLVNIWATWCAPCLEEIPELVALAESRSDIQVIGMAIEWQDRQQVLQFAEGMFVNYPIVLARRDDAEAIGRIRGLPASFIFDPEGRLAAHHTGALTRRQVERLMDTQPTSPRPSPPTIWRDAGNLESCNAPRPLPGGRAERVKKRPNGTLAPSPQSGEGGGEVGLSSTRLLLAGRRGPASARPHA